MNVYDTANRLAQEIKLKLRVKKQNYRIWKKEIWNTIRGYANRKE